MTAVGKIQGRRASKAAALAAAAESFENTLLRRFSRFAVSLSAVFVVLCACNATSANARTRHHKAAVDPVVAVITTAAKRRQITTLQRDAYLADWGASAHAQKQLATRNGPKAAQIAGARAIATTLARRRRLGVDRLALVLGGVHATTDVMLHRRYPDTEARIKLAGDAATYGFYPGYGVQLQPLFSFAEGNADAQAGDAVGAAAIADRMLDFDTSRPHYRAWEYAFPWQGTTLPWTSAMTQATAMQFYARTWQLTSNPVYLATARAVMPGFLRAASHGGEVTGQGSGTWFLLYPFNPAQRILNGHLQSMIGIYDYGQITGDTRAASLVQSGIDAVVPILGKFDTGAWSRYQYGQEADLNYHDFMTLQLRKLFDRTQLQIFDDYHVRFADYRITAPVVSVSPSTSGAVYPVVDGFRDSTSTSFFVDKLSSIAFTVIDANGATVRTYGGVDYARGTHTFAWDGLTSAHRVAPAGSYQLRVQATDVAANRLVTTAPTTFLVNHDTTAPEFLHVRVASAGANHAQVTVKVRDTETGYVVIRVLRGTKVVGRARAGRTGGTVTLPFAASKLGHAAIDVTDSSGNRSTFLL